MIIKMMKIMTLTYTHLSMFTYNNVLMAVLQVYLVLGCFLRDRQTYKQTD